MIKSLRNRHFFLTSFLFLFTLILMTLGINSRVIWPKIDSLTVQTLAIQVFQIEHDKINAEIIRSNERMIDIVVKEMNSPDLLIYLSKIKATYPFDFNEAFSGRSVHLGLNSINLPENAKYLLLYSVADQELITQIDLQLIKSKEKKELL